MGSKLSSLVFQPPEVSYFHTKKQIIWLRAVRFSGDNTSSSNAVNTGISIPAFYLDRKSKITILFSHGNAEDLGLIYEWFCEFSKAVHVNVLAYDYEGYGKAVGHPNEQSCYANIDAAYAFLTETLHIIPEHIVLFGRSLGSGPSCYLAERLHGQNVQLGGMILQSPLLSIFRVAFDFRLTLPYDMFPNIDRIKNTHCPIFIIHGVKDEIVPFWNGEQLFLTAPIAMRAKPLWVEDGGHNNLEELLSENNAFFQHIIDFLTDWVPAYSSMLSKHGSQTSSRKSMGTMSLDGKTGGRSSKSYVESESNRYNL